MMVCYSFIYIRIYIAIGIMSVAVKQSAITTNWSSDHQIYDIHIITAT